MTKDSFRARALKIAHKLSPAFLILGISLIGWASYQIYVQSAPEPILVELPEEQPEALALAPEPAAAEREQETQTEQQAEIEKEAEKETQPEIQGDSEVQAETVPQTQEQPVETQREVTTTVETAPQTATASQKTDSSAPQILYPVRPTVGENIGNLRLPAINQVLPIVHGTDEDELSRGIGHFAGSVLPGEKDNSVLSGHRDTVFRELGQLKITDQLIVETAAGTFTYEIREIKIVPKDDKSIITPTSTAVLTVTTCYPFNFIGNAPDRYILIADLVSSE